MRTYSTHTHTSTNSGSSLCCANESSTICLSAVVSVCVCSTYMRRARTRSHVGACVLCEFRSYILVYTYTYLSRHCINTPNAAHTAHCAHICICCIECIIHLKLHWFWIFDYRKQSVLWCKRVFVWVHTYAHVYYNCNLRGVWCVHLILPYELNLGAFANHSHMCRHGIVIEIVRFCVYCTALYKRMNLIIWLASDFHMCVYVGFIVVWLFKTIAHRCVLPIDAQAERELANFRFRWLDEHVYFTNYVHPMITSTYVYWNWELSFVI